jgi:hypothetical protein
LETPEAGAGSMTRAHRPLMPRGFVLFGDDCAYVGLVAIVAPAGHSCPALATFSSQARSGWFSHTHPVAKTNGTVFVHSKSYLSSLGCVLVGLFFVQSFLQFPLCLQIELLVPTLWLTGLLPKFIRAADNIYSGRPCHDDFPILPPDGPEPRPRPGGISGGPSGPRPCRPPS